MKILVDADACPVQDPIITIGKKEQLPVILVKNFSHYSHEKMPAHVKVVYVDKGSDVADFRILKLTKKNDLIITQDYGLAALGLGKGAIAMHHKGFLYTQENIDQLLQNRYISAMARKSGQRTKGPKVFTKEEEEKFCQLLQQTITQMKQNK